MNSALIREARVGLTIIVALLGVFVGVLVMRIRARNAAIDVAPPPSPAVADDSTPPPKLPKTSKPTVVAASDDLHARPQNLPDGVGDDWAKTSPADYAQRNGPPPATYMPQDLQQESVRHARHTMRVDVDAADSAELPDSPPVPSAAPATDAVANELAKLPLVDRSNPFPLVDAKATPNSNPSQPLHPHHPHANHSPTHPRAGSAEPRALKPAAGESEASFTRPVVSDDPDALDEDDQSLNQPPVDPLALAANDVLPNDVPSAKPPVARHHPRNALPMSVPRTPVPGEAVPVQYQAGNPPPLTPAPNEHPPGRPVPIERPAAASSLPPAPVAPAPLAPGPVPHKPLPHSAGPHGQSDLPPPESVNAGRLPPRVASRPTTPIESSEGAPDGKYVIQPNDNFWTISRKVYGTGAFFKALYMHNREAHPWADRMKVGHVLAVPPVDTLMHLYPDLCPRAERHQSLVRRAQIVQTRGRALRGGGRVYIVEEGDTLFDIAKHQLGDATRWPEIYQLNRDLLGDDFDFLNSGMELAIPDADSQPDNITTRPRNDSAR